MWPGTSMYVRAEDPVTYLDAEWNETTKKVEYTQKEITEYTVVDGTTTAWGDNGWYVANGKIYDVDTRITVTGTANLILCDGSELALPRGIKVTQGNTLNIYAQSSGENEGKLLADGYSVYNAGIGGGGGVKNGGNIAIFGGKVTVRGGYFAAGIGGGDGGAGGKITITGGEVTATGNDYGAGIGGGQYGAEGEITINGGKVTATGGINGAGIGGGYQGAGGVVSIKGGIVSANGGIYAAGIGGGSMGSGGTVKIDGGVVKAYAGSSDVATKAEGVGRGAASQEAVSGSLDVDAGVKRYGGTEAEPTEELTDDSRPRYMYFRSPAQLTGELTAKTGLVYTGAEQDLIDPAILNSTSVIGGTALFAVTGSDTEPADEALYTGLRKVRDAGKYYIRYKVKGEDGYLDSEAESIPVEIAKADITITADDKSGNIGEDIKDLTYKVEGDP
ncbi:MAG: hypothetical protein K6B44_02205, partial [Lachnospiraceae bacterium]|nr:hypothetical protein [Lachnospiraceae bacterium]